LGAPLIVTVPISAPEGGVHVLEDPLVENGAAAPELLLQVAELSSRLARALKPRPLASCGRTVMRRTKLAAAMTPSRACRDQFFIAQPPKNPA
jgi:hypothetical protein